MNRSPALLIAAIVAISTGAALSAPVPRFAVFEAELTAEGSYNNPYAQLTAEAELAAPDGKRHTALLFWDGGRTWKLRFSPAQPGAWTYRVRSSDPGLNGKSGDFEVAPSDRAGSIQPMQGHPLHFQRQDGKPFWFLGDTAWAMFTDNEQEKHDRQAALRYIDARADQGFNVLHSMLLSEAGWGNRGGLPFTDIAAEQLNPDYWKEVDVRLAHANARGIVCGLALAWGDKGRGERFPWSKFPDAQARERYARYIAARYSAYDVYFLVSGEWHAEIRARKSSETEIKQEFVEIGNVLQAADPHGRMIAIHPMTSHGSVREFVGTPWMSFGDYQQNYRGLHARVLQSLATNKPVVNSEYGYHLRDQTGDGVPDKENSASLKTIRDATWDLVMAGGYVVTGFGTTYFGGNRDPGPFDLEAEKNDAWESQLGHVKRFFSSLPWWELQPHDELLRCTSQRGEDGKELGLTAPPKTTYWCLAAPGQNYVVYARGLKEPVELSLAGGGRFALTQFNPQTGSSDELGQKQLQGRYSFQPPDQEDCVLVLRRAPDAR